MTMSNKTYDRLKMVALLLMPLITFLAALGDIWHIPYTTQITATLAALDTLLGACLKVSTDAYYEGQKKEPQEPYLPEIEGEE